MPPTNRPQPLPRIPLAVLPAKPKDTTMLVGHVYAHETYIPVIQTTTPEGVFLRLNVGHENLGSELTDISARLTAADVKALCKGREVKL